MTYENDLSKKMGPPQSAVISVRANRVLKWVKTFLGIVWLVLCILVLVTTFRVADPFAHSEEGIFMVLAMTMLSFPASYVMGSIIGAVSLLAHELSSLLDISYWKEFLKPYDIYRYYFSLLFVWALFFVAGYLQWFKLVPWLILRLIAKFDSYKKSRRLAEQRAE